MVAGSLASGKEVNFSGSDEVTDWYRYDVSGNSNQKVVTHTFKYNGQVLRNYSMLYDKTKKAALWVACVMNADMYPWIVSRGDNWNYDPALVFGSDYSWQPNLSSSYVDYTRGHQIASNDRRTTIYQMYQTDYFSNMTPQLSGFNSGMWASLEGEIQKIGNATTGNDMLYVVTGPVFGDGYGKAKDKSGTECAVPTQYFKCIMKVTYSGGNPVSAKGAAYLMDHVNSGSVRQAVTIHSIEELTGFDFFANIPASLQATAEYETHLTTDFPQKTIPTSN